MIGSYNALDALFDFQRALDSRLESDWLRGATAGTGAFPPINVFQQGDSLVAIREIAGVDKGDLEIQAKDNAIRISGKKAIAYPEGVSVHRRERPRCRPLRRSVHSLLILPWYLPRSPQTRPYG